MKKRGIAKGNFRADSRSWDAAEKMNQPTAKAARERMAAGGGSLTDSVVRDVLGGNMAAANQAEAYGDVIGNIKAGKGTRGKAGNLADAARNRMIERDSEKNRGEDKHPDKGRDKADRRAYPPTSRA